MNVRRPAVKTLGVAIVSRNPETLDGLQAYLSGAGVASRCTSEIDDCWHVAPASTLAFVLFPDDFPWERAVAALASLAAERPRALPVLVTAHPKRFAELADATRVVVVPKPVWGWMILDAIRAHLDGPESIEADVGV
jgi:hypothetical protein